MIVMSKTSDTPRSADTGGRPLNARSLALSALLGTHPPALSARALVELAEVFGINGGTMRTALSRMLAAGDVTSCDGRYALAPRLLQRQAAQDAGRQNVLTPWDGAWHTAVATVDHRDLADRRQLRSLMVNARFGELRPSVWARPANLPAPELGTDWLVTTGPIDGTPPAVLVDRLWHLDDVADTARALIARLGAAAVAIDHDDPAALPPAFSLSADVVRFLRTDPLLPHELLPGDWPVDTLRHRYDRFERDVQALLRPILSDAAAA